MVEIRCSVNLNSKNITELVQEVDIITFPQGEADFSILRGADGQDSTIVFRGIDKQSILGSDAFGLADTKNVMVFQPVENVNPIDIYATIRTNCPSLAQTAFGNPAFCKCVKDQFNRQFCPPGVSDENRINISQFIDFVNKWLTNPSIARWAARGEQLYREVRREIIRGIMQPAQAIFNRPETELTDFSLEKLEEIGASFYREFLSEDELQRAITCRNYSETGYLQEGSLIQLDLNGCDNTGRAITEKNTKDATEFTSGIDALSTTNQNFNFADHLFAAQTQSSNVIFRRNALDTEYETASNEGSVPNARVGPDLRAFDFSFDDYNVNFTNLSTDFQVD